MTIFTLKEGKITPISIIKSGKSLTLDEYAALGAPAPAPARQPNRPNRLKRLQFRRRRQRLQRLL